MSHYKCDVERSSDTIICNDAATVFIIYGPPVFNPSVLITRCSKHLFIDSDADDMAASLAVGAFTITEEEALVWEILSS